MTMTFSRVMLIRGGMCREEIPLQDPEEQTRPRFLPVDSAATRRRGRNSLLRDLREADVLERFPLRAFREARAYGYKVA